MKKAAIALLNRLNQLADEERLWPMAACLFYDHNRKERGVAVLVPAVHEKLYRYLRPRKALWTFVTLPRCFDGAIRIDAKSVRLSVGQDSPIELVAREAEYLRDFFKMTIRLGIGPKEIDLPDDLEGAEVVAYLCEHWPAAWAPPES